MAAVEKRIETKTRAVYTLPSPTNWAEVGKTLAVIRADMEAAGIDTSWDDIVTVEAADEEIRFSYEVEESSR